MSWSTLGVHCPREYATRSHTSTPGLMVQRLSQGGRESNIDKEETAADVSGGEKIKLYPETT